MNTSELPDSVRLRFPDLRPVNRVPTLFRINGIGLGMYGKRDYDRDTATYIKTYCLCFVFIPVIALAAYRVADAERGWFFIGKSHLSSFAKSCNLGVLLLSLLFCGILADHAYTSSPEYRARQDVRYADAALKTGKPLEAARIYRDVALGTTAQAGPARDGLRQSLEKSLASDAPDQVEAGFRLLTSLPASLNSPVPVLPDSYQRGLSLVEKFRVNNPEGSLGLLRQVTVLAGPTNASLKPLEIDLLKAAINANPDNTNRVVELALIYEDQKQLELSYQLLGPYAKKLGATEGARLLGQHLLQQGQHEDAYGLLYPYVQARLEKLRAIERNYTNTIAQVYKRCIKDLNDGRADQSFYAAYKKGSKAEKEAMVDAYVQKQMQSDRSYKKAVADLTAGNTIVHVSLDLGMVQLNRAQNLTDPAARRSELMAAEKTFLAIRGLAGDTDEYRLFLGQVDYWLGKSKEGGELFARLLEDHQRAFALLMRLAHVLREVGDYAQARDLAEEAYRAGKSNRDKFDAAEMRARLDKDVEDQIAWLEKSDPDDPKIQIGLNSARGGKALRDGNRDLAAQFLRKAIDGYQRMPQNATTLNNCALSCFDLYYATGDIKEHNRGLGLLEQAVALAPGDSVLLNNITHLLIARAYMDVVGDSIHFADLKQTPDHTMLGHLYKDEPGRAVAIERLRQNEHLKKALACLDKALLLAPKNPSLYGLSLHLQETFRDAAELQKLQQRIRVASPELSETLRDTREAYDAAKDQERLGRLQNEIRRYQAMLEIPSVKEHSSTLDFVEVILNGLGQGAGLSGEPADSQKILDHALANHQSHPTSASLNTLVAACFYRAHDQLKQQNPVYAELAERTRRSLSPRELIALLFDHNDALAALIRQNPNVVKALQLMREEGRLFPSFRQPDEWALFRTVDAEEAALVSRQVKADRPGRLADELRFQLNPISSTAVLRQYWTAELNGDQTAATAIYQQALRDGVPLPAL